jgi:hypothetical protein
LSRDNCLYEREKFGCSLRKGEISFPHLEKEKFVSPLEKGGFSPTPYLPPSKERK